jgi:hypothetical protein
MGIFKVNDITMNSDESIFGKWVYDIKCTTVNMRQGSCEDKEALRNAIENIEYLYADELPEFYIYGGRGNGKTYNWRNEYQKERDKFDIKDVIFNNPATIVLWADGTKTVVKAENEEFDPEKGLAMAIAKKALGNNYDYYDIFKKYVGKYEKKQKKGGK